MNINKTTLSILTACTMVLTGCDFSEDDCPRNGLLRAWADFDRIVQSEIPKPADCHLLAFGTRSYDIPSATFSADTLYWSLPRDSYRFLYYSGNYLVGEKSSPYSVTLSVPTVSMNGRTCIIAPQSYCSTAMFDREICYQRTTDAEIVPTQFVQRIHIRVNVIGEHRMVQYISTSLSGVCTTRCVSSRASSGSAVLVSSLTHVRDTHQWVDGNWVFGFNSDDRQLLTLDVRMDKEHASLSEKRSVDLTPFLVNNDASHISVEMDLVIGKELTIDHVTTLPDWVDVPEEDLTK